MKLSELIPSVPVSTGNPRGGIDLTFDLDSSADVCASDCWHVAGRNLQFIRLGPAQRLELDDDIHYIKVILGFLENTGHGCFAAPFSVRSTRFTDSGVIAGETGALFAILTETNRTPASLSDMTQVQFSGPSADALKWRSFEEKFGAFVDTFNGLDCHMVDGFHLLDQQGTEIVYLNLWTCGKDDDVSTHNHSGAPSDMAPAFAEVHWVIDNGTGAGGMYQTAEPGHPERERQVMVRGEEHGPYFEIDPATKRPALHDNGAVKYGWHGWQGGTDDRQGQAYDFIAAFEINPDYAVIPTDMI